MSARSSGVFLLEIGTEEIPARMIEGALEDLASGLVDELEGARLIPGAPFSRDRNVETFGTPRRLGIRITDLRERQADAEEEVTGPPVTIAFDSSGKPTKAAEGFARAQGVPVGELLRIASPKGDCVGVRKVSRGLSATEVLARRIPALLGSLTFPKMMRWGSGEFRFVRPIHWIVALFDHEVVDLTFAGVRSGNRSSGHRLRGAQPIAIPDPMKYVELLREHLVAVRAVERAKRIQDDLNAAARRHDAALAAPPGSPAGAAGDPELLREVTHAAEWPHVVEGEFDASFLDLPEEILVTAMRHHQKSFALRRPSGRLLNRFLAIADTEGDPREAIRRGNEWVLRARLADARFFWQEDRKTPLARHAAALERVTFHEKLGSYARKVDRMARLAGPVLDLFERSGHRPDRGAVEAAIALLKVDLTTQMVKEFPELEGIVGGLYARAEGLPENVARAIYAHYLPRGAEDPLPGTLEGAIAGLLDRLDTQAGIFLLGIVPTGSRDPYGLRRSVLGACRILIDHKVRASLSNLTGLAFDGYGDETIAGSVASAEAKAALLEFYRARLQFLGESGGLRQDSVRAALTASADDPHEARLRMAALDTIREDPGFLALALAHKRIKNILKERPPGEFEPGLLKEEAERALERALREAVPSIEAAQSGADPLKTLREIARLGPALDRFFTEVMVMAEDARLRANRLGLLNVIARLFMKVGDFSEIVVEAERAAPQPARGPGKAGRR